MQRRPGVAVAKWDPLIGGPVIAIGDEIQAKTHCHSPQNHQN